MGKRCYLPVLHPLHHRSLWFIEYKPQDPLVKNRFGILEPIIKGNTIVPAWSLDLVLTPIVAFDHNLHRLGMGLGYYDHTFSFLRQHNIQDTIQHPFNVPVLLGLAYAFQEVHTLPHDHWDIPLAGIATEKEILSSN